MANRCIMAAWHCGQMSTCAFIIAECTATTRHPTILLPAMAAATWQDSKCNLIKSRKSGKGNCSWHLRRLMPDGHKSAEMHCKHQRSGNWELGAWNSELGAPNCDQRARGYINIRPRLASDSQANCDFYDLQRSEWIKCKVITYYKCV